MPIELKNSAIRKIKDYLNEQTKDISIPKDSYKVLIVRIEMNEKGDDFECKDLVMDYYDKRDTALRVLEYLVYEATPSSLFTVGLVMDYRKRYLMDADNQLYVVYHNPKSYTHYPVLLELSPNTTRSEGERRRDGDDKQSGCGGATARD
jgi:hypothetical protein